MEDSNETSLDVEHGEIPHGEWRELAGREVAAKRGAEASS